MEYLIKKTWDPEACVWIATSDNAPGLALESGSFGKLVARVTDALSDLLGVSVRPNIISIMVKSSYYIAGTSMEGDRL